jgi:hypothetical protein
MKKIFVSFIISATMLFANDVFAACTPATTAPPIDGGFFPASNTQPCVVKSVPVSGLVIQLKNFGNITNDVFVISTRIDTVLGLPSGLSWNMTVPSANPANTLLTDEIGCIEITGTTTASIGNYDLDFAVTVEVSLSGQVQTIVGRTSELVQVFNNQFGTEADFSYFLNVVENQAACTNVGVKEVANISGFNIYPNPVNNKSLVTFFSKENETFIVRVLDVMGKEVYSENIFVTSGINNIDFKSKNISGGVYFFTLSDGKGISTKRIIVE